MNRVLESDTRTRSAHGVEPAGTVGFFVGFFGFGMAGIFGEGKVGVGRFGG